MCTAAARRPTSKTHSNFEARTKSRSTQVGLTEEDGKGGERKGREGGEMPVERIGGREQLTL